MNTVYAIGCFYPQTSSIAELGTLPTEEEARAYCARGTRVSGSNKTMKIVKRLATASSGDVIAFYKNGVECSYEESIKTED
jgi:hypothetical protein